MSLTRRTLGRAGMVRELERAAGVENATRRVLLYLVVPLWVADCGFPRPDAQATRRVFWAR